jgi:large subunit ribosomal protein L25
MSLDRSLKSANALIRHRNVLTRDERLAKLKEMEKWNEAKSVFGLPKVAHRKLVVGGKGGAKEEVAEGAAGAVAGAAATGAAPAAATGGAKAPAAKAGAAPAKGAAAPAKGKTEAKPGAAAGAAAAPAKGKK